MPFQLGRKPPAFDPRTLKLGDYLSPMLSPPPSRRTWRHGVVDWGLMLNDELGDCAIAAAGHAVQDWSLNATGKIVTIPDAAIEKAYEDVGGYRPGHPETDGGCVELDVLKYWRRAGVGGHRIYGFASVNPRHTTHIFQTVNLFGGAYLGLALPAYLANRGIIEAQDAWVLPDPLPSDGSDLPGSLGGHAVWMIGYDATAADNDPHGMQIVTWGAVVGMSRAFFARYGDPGAGGECWAVLSRDWAPVGQRPAPSGFDFAALQADLKGVAS